MSAGKTTSGSRSGLSPEETLHELRPCKGLVLAAAKAEELGTKAVAPDAYIAATALAREFAVATRNRKHFESMGVAVINPWEE